jgi:cobalt/nickel transport system ATP-binding protein
VKDAPTSDRATPAIEATAIRYAYPDGLSALDDLSLHVMPGELVAVMGSNGAGKTTLMKVLMRLLHPQKGQVLLGGSDIAELRPAELYRRVGMVFQNPADQLFATTVAEDVAFGPRNMGLAEEEVAVRVEAALSIVEVTALRDRPIHHLSFGEQKRVCLACVLAMHPTILVLDEPTAGLDPMSETHMIELLVRLNRQQGITVIVCTHSVDLLPVLADRICVLDRGRIVRQGPPHEVLTDRRSAAQAGLRLPLVTQLFQELSSRHGIPMDRLPLTVDEARQDILQWITAGVRPERLGKDDDENKDEVGDEP